MNTKGQSLRLYFIDGTPDGMLTAEVFNWTGHILMAPRTRISDALKRREAGYTGVYVLVGEDPESGELKAYIGEGEDISSRIRMHDTQKEWWDTAIIITSASNNLNKAHAKYLEARLIETARSIGKAKLDNSISPERPSLVEADQSDMEKFLEYVLMILPALRIDIFWEKTRKEKESSRHNASAPPKFEFSIKKDKIHAFAILENGEFVVQKGSKARKEWIGAEKHGSYKKLFEELKSTGILKEEGDYCIFTENYAFSSPSAAAAVVAGRNANGLTSWKVRGQNKTYKEWEAEQLSA